jgi:hypothetical protein
MSTFLHVSFRFVKVLMILLFIIAWPISKLLDCLLGHEHSTFFRRAGYEDNALLQDVICVVVQEEWQAVGMGWNPPRLPDSPDQFLSPPCRLT